MCRTRPRETVKDLLHADLRQLRAISYTGAGHNALTCDVNELEATFTMAPAATPWPIGAVKVQQKHGLWPEDVARMREEQQGKCYLCGGPLPASGYMLAIDHDHRCCPRRKSCSYCRRGLACHSCNLLIGHAHDDPQVLRRIADNLEAAITDVTRRLAAKPAQVDLHGQEELDRLAALAPLSADRKPAVRRPKVKATPEQPADQRTSGGGRDVLADVLSVFGDAKTLHWGELAELLAARFPDRWAGSPKQVISAQVRALGVPGATIRYPASRGGQVLWGCRRTDVETVIANCRFWAGW